MKLSKKTKELMKDGHDFQAREEACDRLQKIIRKSNHGEIGIGDFIEEVAQVNRELKRSLNLWEKNL